METSVVLSIVVASALGSLHCAGMCGGLAAFATSSPDEPARRRAVALVAYNATRGVGYVLLGTTAGALGSTLDRAGLRVGIGRVAGIVAGLTMIGWGLVRLSETAGIRLRGRSASRAVLMPPSSLIRKIRNQSPVVRATVVGGCTAALPCGFLHAFLVLAAGTGSAALGALVTAAFWLGTVPALVGLGVGTSAVYAPLRRHAPVLGAVVLVGFGLTTLLGRWSPALAPLVGDGSAELLPNADSPPCHVR